MEPEKAASEDGALVSSNPPEGWQVDRSQIAFIGNNPERPECILAERETYGPDNVGGFCDGIAFDSYGNLWSTLIMADRLIAVTAQGDVLTLLDDGDAEATAVLDEAWEERRVTPEVMAGAGGTLAPWMASLIFGGPDLKTVCLGSLRGSRIPVFRSPVAGRPLIDW